jgi:hypothetical protein
MSMSAEDPDHGVDAEGVRAAGLRKTPEIAQVLREPHDLALL